MNGTWQYWYMLMNREQCQQMQQRHACCMHAACEWHLAVLVHVVEDRAVFPSQEALHLLLKIILQKTRPMYSSWAL